MDLKNLLVAFHNDEDGATATEYIILLILIACVIIFMVRTFGSVVYKKFNDAQKKVSDDVKF
jgi:Flp pilus assembly pilin Flp